MTNSRSDDSTQIPGLSTQILEHETLFSRVQAGSTLITGNSRLARVLTGLYNQWRVRQGDRQWASPKIISWDRWLDQFWETAALQGIAGTRRAVPGSRQLISLWETTLRKEKLAQKLLRPESLATQLRDTRRLVTEWQLDKKDPAWFGVDSENHAAFKQWNKGFEKHCANGGWISPEDRTALLCKATGDGLSAPDQSLDLIGFDEFTPDQADLISALINNGSLACQLTLAPKQDKAVLWKSRDSKDELVQMARWVRYWFEKEPDSSIAIVVPDLQTRRRSVERHLENILAPGSNGSQSTGQTMEYLHGYTTCPDTDG